MKRRYPPRSQRTTNWAARRPAQGLGYVVVRMAPLALIALAVIFDQVTPANWPFNRFLEGAPALAAASWSPVGTGVIGAFAFVVDIALAADKGNLGMSRAWLTLG